MARLLLVRHAPTPETGKKLTGRLPGVSLDHRGREVARAVSARLEDVRISAVYSSPIERAWETAQIVAAPHGLDPVPTDGLLEVDYGTWSGRTLASLSKLKAWHALAVTPSRVVFPGGESLADAQRRAVATCEELAREHGRATVALVTHSDIIRLIVSNYLGQPLDLLQRIDVATGSVTVVDVPLRGIPVLVSLNSNGGQGSWR